MLKNREVYLLESSARAYLALNSSRMLKTEFFLKTAVRSKKRGNHLGGGCLHKDSHMLLYASCSERLWWSMSFVTNSRTKSNLPSPIVAKE